MMCPGKEFGITDAIFGIIEAIVFMAAYFTLGDMPLWMTTMFIVSIVGWFAMSAYCFRFASKCNCQEIYKNLGIK